MAAFTPTGAASGSGSPKTVTNPTIENLTATGAESSYALPAGTKRFEITNRGNRRVTITYVTAGAKVKTLFPNAPYKEDNIGESASLTIYLIAAGGSQAVEIVSWA